MSVSSQRGFTLVELMIVVAIVGVLAVVAGTAYRRYMDAGRTAEVYAMMGEFRNKEEAYRAEFSQYLATSSNETTFFPVLLGAGKEPKAKSVAARPAAWVTLGINPGKSMLYCGYAALAGAPGTAPSGTLGTNMLGSTALTTPWWYVIGTCDNDSDGNAGHNAYFTTTSANTQVVSQNEHW